MLEIVHDLAKLGRKIALTHDGARGVKRGLTGDVNDFAGCNLGHMCITYGLLQSSRIEQFKRHVGPPIDSRLPASTRR